MKRIIRRTGKRGSRKRKHQRKLQRVPKSVVLSELVNKNVAKWQGECTQSTKGRTTKEFSPDVTERLKMKINLTQNFTTMVTSHGKNKLIFTPFQNNRRADMPLQHQRSEYRTPTV